MRSMDTLACLWRASKRPTWRGTRQRLQVADEQREVAHGETAVAHAPGRRDEHRPVARLAVFMLNELSNCVSSAVLEAALRRASLIVRKCAMTCASALLTLTACTAPKISPRKPVAEYPMWYGLFAPARTPRDIVDNCISRHSKHGRRPRCTTGSTSRRRALDMTRTEFRGLCPARDRTEQGAGSERPASSPINRAQDWPDRHARGCTEPLRRQCRLRALHRTIGSGRRRNLLVGRPARRMRLRSMSARYRPLHRGGYSSRAAVERLCDGSGGRSDQHARRKADRTTAHFEPSIVARRCHSRTRHSTHCVRLAIEFHSRPPSGDIRNASGDCPCGAWSPVTSGISQRSFPRADLPPPATRPVADLPLLPARKTPASAL